MNRTVPSLVSLDASGRPHVILVTRIDDIKITKASEKMYAEAELGRGGKTWSLIV